MLYLKTIKREPKDTLFTFLEKCLKKKSFKSYGIFPKTYKDIECTKLEYPEAYRSFEVIVEISKTYFKVSEKQVAKTIKKIIVKDENRKLGFLLCLATNKWILHSITVYLQPEKENNFILKYSNSINRLDEKGKGKYNFNEIDKLMND